MRRETKEEERTSVSTDNDQLAGCLVSELFSPLISCQTAIDKEFDHDERNRRCGYSTSNDPESCKKHLI